MAKLKCLFFRLLVFLLWEPGIWFEKSFPRPSFGFLRVKAEYVKEHRDKKWQSSNETLPSFGFPLLRAEDVQETETRGSFFWKLINLSVLWFSSCKNRGNTGRLRREVEELESQCSIRLLGFLVGEPRKNTMTETRSGIVEKLFLLLSYCFPHVRAKDVQKDGDDRWFDLWSYFSARIFVFLVWKRRMYGKTETRRGGIDISVLPPSFGFPLLRAKDVQEQGDER